MRRTRFSRPRWTREREHHSTRLSSGSTGKVHPARALQHSDPSQAAHARYTRYSGAITFCRPFSAEAVWPDGYAANSCGDDWCKKVYEVEAGPPGVVLVVQGGERMGLGTLQYELSTCSRSRRSSALGCNTSRRGRRRGLPGVRERWLVSHAPWPEA